MLTDTVVQCVQPTERGNRVPDWPSWSIEQAAEETGYNPQYIRRLCRAGKVVHERIGRTYLVSVDSLREYKKQAERELGQADARFGPRRPGRN
jgi:excisionase family DNA binding protein